MKRFVLCCLVLALVACCVGAPYSLAGESGDTFSFSAMINSRGLDAPDTIANEAWLAKMEELMGMNVDIDWLYVPNADYDSKMSILLSSGDLPDYFLFPFLYNYTDMAKDGYFLDFAQYDMPNYMALVDKSREGRDAITMEDGSIPGLWQVILPTCPEGRMPLFNNCAMWNYTALTRDGIQIPSTLEELYESAKAYKELHPQSFPVNTTYQGVFPVFYAYHTYATTQGAGTLYWNGTEYTFAGFDEGYKKGLEYLVKLFSEGLLDPEYIVETVDTVKTKAFTEQNVLYLNVWRTHPTTYTIENNGDMVFTAAFFPDAQDEGKAWQSFSYANQVSLLNWTIHAVNADFPEPELMAKFIDLQFTPEVYEITSWGVEGVSYTVDEQGNKRFIDEFYSVDDPSTIADKYGLWNDRSGKVTPGIRLIQDNMAREVSFPVPDYTWFNGVYEEAPIQDSTYFLSCEWPNEYVPPMYDEPVITLTSEENEIVSTILTPLQTYTSQMQAQFIDGTSSLDEWDSFMAAFQGYDLQTVLDIYNEAAQRALNK